MIRDGQGHTTGDNTTTICWLHDSGTLLDVLHAFFPILPMNLQHIQMRLQH